MKKTISILLSIIMLLEFSLPCFAAAQNLGVSSPEFKDAKIVNIAQLEDGSYVENLSYHDGNIAITMIAKHREEGIDFPNIDSETSFPSVLYKFLGSLSINTNTYSESNYGYPGKDVSFTSGKKDENQIQGRSLALWTDNFVFIFIIYTDKSAYDGKANGFQAGEARDIFDKWINSIKVTELEEVKAEPGDLYSLEQTL